MGGILSKQEKRMQLLAHIVMIFLSVLALVPFWLLIAASFSDSNYAVAEGYRFIPKVFSLDAYQYILQQWNQIGRAYLVTLTVTAVGTVSSILIVSLLSYGLSQKRCV